MCKQNKNRWDQAGRGTRFWWEEFEYSMLMRLWILSIALTLQRSVGYSSVRPVLLKKYHGKRQRRHSRGLVLVWQAAPQRECQPTPEATQLQQDIQDLSTHFTAIIHEKTGIRQHLTLTSVPRDIYKNPLNSFCLRGTKPLSVLQANLN